MNEAHSAVYALIQALHNFGAVAVLGGALAGMSKTAGAQAERRLLRLVLAGWLLQAASGAGFGVATWNFYHKLPDISGIALYALILKAACALIAITLCAAGVRAGPGPRGWRALTVLAAVALAAAAVLRWYS